MGLGLDDFDRCTPGEFRAIYDQWSANEQRVDRSSWERTRMMCLCMLQPYSKGSLKPDDIMRFPWDEGAESIQDRQNESQGENVPDLKTRFAEAKARYGLR